MLRPKTVKDVFCSHEPAIGTIVRELGETKARAAVAYLLADALEFFNAANTMNDIQAAMTVDLIMEEYPYMKTDDLKLCFKNAMKMRYGNVYNRIDGQVVMSWLREYNKERCTEADNQSWNESKAYKAVELKHVSGVFYDEYRKELEIKAANGDEEAKKALELSNDITSFLSKQRLERQKADLERFYMAKSKEHLGDNTK